MTRIRLEAICGIKPLPVENPEPLRVVTKDGQCGDLHRVFTSPDPTRRAKVRNTRSSRDPRPGQGNDPPRAPSINPSSSSRSRLIRETVTRSPPPGSNRRPPVYKTGALPTELGGRVARIGACCSMFCTPAAGAAGSGGAARRRPDRREGSDNDFARVEVLADLALDPLEGVVDRLGVAAEQVGHLFVGAVLEVEAARCSPCPRA